MLASGSQVRGEGNGKGVQGNVSLCTVYVPRICRKVCVKEVIMWGLVEVSGICVLFLGVFIVF